MGLHRRNGMTLAAAMAAAGIVAGVVAAPAQSAPLPGAGTVLSSAPLTTVAALPSAASTRVITYTSDDDRGRPIVVSGTVAVPRGKAPRGGWPVLSWAHGTTGYADACAPSADTADGLDHDYLGPITADLDTWIRKGYAVVQTDYQGLGTPGGHPYLNGISEANTVIDIVRAAHNLDPSIGRNWAVAGHSQGGQATLFTAQRAKSRAPQFPLRAAVAIAPGGPGLGQLVPYVKSGLPGSQANAAFLPLIVLGAAVADPAVHPDQIFSRAAAPVVKAAQTGCIAQIRAVPQIPAGQLFAPNADLGPLSAYLQQQDPMTNAVPAVPTMVAQGTADTVVSPYGTHALVAALCLKGVALDYRLYPGKDHRPTVPASNVDAQNFVGAAMAGKPTPRTCG